MPARKVWQAIVNAARDSAEPGLLFLDTIRDANPLREHERIDATNPCGEQPLPPYGSCVLGPVDLPRFVHHPFGIDGEPRFDFAALADAVHIQVRLLDDVLDLTAWAHDALALAVPQQVVCRPGCAGLCPVCGESRNDGRSHDHPQEPDPRWAKLRELQQ